MSCDIKTIKQSSKPKRRNYKTLFSGPGLINFNYNETITKPKRKRSKNGCTNCKRLKIKCNEDYPECEYCIQTGKQCVYPLLKNTKPNIKGQSSEVINIQSNPTRIAETMPSISNKPLQKLNSVSFQLNISKFELQLLKCYIDFGGNFFLKDVSKESHIFWSEDVPKLWCCSDLVKYGLYSASSARLLANYDYDTSKEIYIENEDQNSCPIIPFTINLREQASRYAEKTFELINMYQMMFDDQYGGALNESEDILGQLIVANKLAIGSKVILPRPKQNQAFNKVEESLLFQLMSVTNKTYQEFSKYSTLLKDTKYACIFDPEAIPINQHKLLLQNFSLGFIKYLENYVNDKFDPSDDFKITHQSAISRLEYSCHQTIYFQNTISLFRALVYITRDSDFLDLLKKEDHIAMKIMFYSCCLNSIFHDKIYQRNGVHNEFLEFYVNYSKDKFKGGWEDDVDRNIYGWVQKRARCNYGFDLNAIKYVGEPIDKVPPGVLRISEIQTSIKSTQ